MARGVADLTEKLGVVLERIAKSCEDTKNVCIDLSDTTDHVAEVRMSLSGIRAFLSREAAFGNYQ